MSTPREGPNPLRPYYIPPSVGSPPDPPASGPGAFSSRGRHAPTSTASFGSSARNILSDIDYSDYLAADSPSPPDIIKRLVEQASWKYLSVFLAQPFEVTKTILQVHVARASSKGNIRDTLVEDSRRRHDIYEVRAVSIARRYQSLTSYLEFFRRRFRRLSILLHLQCSSRPYNWSPLPSSASAASIS